MDTLKRYLAKHPLFFFHDIKNEYLEILEENSEVQHYDAGRHIFRSGEDADHFFVIQVGEVAIQVHGHKRGDINLQTVSSGEVLGFSWLMEPYQYRFDALVLEPTMVRAFDAQKLRKIIASDPGFGYDLVHRFNVVISQRLQASRLQILEMYGDFSLDDVE